MIFAHHTHSQIVAPALYEGIPGFLDEIKEGMSELAVYSSLYMALVSTLAFTGFRPVWTLATLVSHGVYASMMLHSGVVGVAVFHRLGAIGHLRDSDKLLVSTVLSTFRPYVLPIRSTNLVNFTSVIDMLTN